MKCAQFIRHVIGHALDFAPEHPVCVVAVQEYESLFWSLVRERLAEHGERVVMVSPEYQETHAALLLTSPTIDGPCIVILVERQEGKIRDLGKDLTALLVKYRGPHRVIALVPPTQAKKLHANYVEIGRDTLDEETYQALTALVGCPSLPALGKGNTLDQVCMFLMAYRLLGSSGLAWLQDNLLSEDKGSLFLLTQYLLGGECEKFYALWSVWHDLYPDEFWISFWGERFWQAYVWISIKRGMHKILETVPQPKVLPFQFMKRDWKSYSCNIFAAALRHIYMYDTHLKTGGSIIPFESLFNIFLKK